MSKRHRAGPTKSESIAITGTSGFVGAALFAALQQEMPGTRLVAIDKQPPKRRLGKEHRYYAVDLTADPSDREVLEILRRERCHTLIHAAVLTQPPRNLENSHELQSIGTMYLLNAAAATPVKKLILVSTTDVYGAFPDNPNFLSEEHPLRGNKLSPFLKDKIDMEQQFLQFQKRHPERVVTLLRLATILGPTVNNFKTNFFQNEVIPTVMGFDPLMQFLHESDVTRAFLKVILSDHPGIFNVVGDGVLPFSRVIRTLGKVAVPIPSPLLYPTAELLWSLDIGPAPSGHVNFLKYLCIADGNRAKKILGLKPIYTSQEALLSFAGKGLR